MGRKMKKRVRGHLYFLHDFKRVDGNYRYVGSNDGTLLAANYGRTKLYASELPEWFVYGRYYKRFGYLSSKGIKALKYVPNMHTNHFLKDDRLMISYSKVGSELDDDDKYDTWVWGNEILDILKGAQIYSDFDIAPIICQMKDKMAWLRETYRDEFCEEKWGFDLDEWMQKPFDNGLPPRYGAITIKTKLNADTTETLYGSEKNLTKFIEDLPNEYQYEKNAFSLRNEELVREVQFLKETFGYLDGFELQYTDSNGETYDLKFHSALLTQIILRDNDRFLLCASADVWLIRYRKVETDEWVQVFDANHNQIVARLGSDKRELKTLAFILVQSYSTAEEAVSAMREVKPAIDTVVKYLFEVRSDAR